MRLLPPLLALVFGLGLAVPIQAAEELRGTVLGAASDGTLYLRGEGGAWRVTSVTDLSIAVGDRLVCTVQPAADPWGRAWRALRVTRDGPGPPPPPRRLHPGETLVAEQQFDLVQVDALLVDTLQVRDDQDVARNGVWLQCAMDGRSFRARLNDHPDGAMLAGLRHGSLLRLTGICELRRGADGRLVGFQLRLRDGRDVVVLHTASWWSAERLAWLLALAASLGVWAITIIWRLRRRVSHQELTIRRQQAHEAVLEERQRIARDLHDTLEQELVGVRLHLDAAEARLDAAPVEVRRILRAARALLDRSQEEARLTIRELHRPESVDPALDEVLRAQLGPLFADTGVELVVAVDGVMRPLNRRRAWQLQRIAQEAVTNALKHARPRQVRIALTFAAESFHIRIEDDGSGCDPGLLDQPPEGHFGVRGMRERARRLGAAIAFTTSQAGGTAVVVSCPYGTT